MDIDDGKEATPCNVLREQIMDSRIPKNEREWWAKREIESQQARIEALEKAARDLLNAETDRWAAQTDHAVFAANAVVVAAHDSLAALLEATTDRRAG